MPIEVKTMEDKIKDGKEVDFEKDPAILKVSSRTEKDKLVIAILKTYENLGHAKVKAVGGGAIKTAYEAILEARAKLIKYDTDLIIIPNGFIATMPDGKMRPGALMVVEKR